MCDGNNFVGDDFRTRYESRSVHNKLRDAKEGLVFASRKVKVALPWDMVGASARMEQMAALLMRYDWEKDVLDEHLREVMTFIVSCKGDKAQEAVLAEVFSSVFGITINTEEDCRYAIGTWVIPCANTNLYPGRRVFG